MHVIPVIDLKDGQVVRGVGGQRNEYCPIVSQLVASAAPSEVAHALCSLVGHDHLYVADLDAIAGGAPNWSAYREILKSASTIIIDAGIATPGAAAALVDFAERHSANASLVVALESSPSPRVLQDVLARIGVARAVFSLDLKHGRPLNDAAAWRNMSPLQIATQSIEFGFDKMIVLDLAAVGMDSGPNVVELCAEIRTRNPGLKLISGGGVRSITDLQAFRDAGCDGVLVASALHDGRITAEDLQNCPFL